MSVNNITSKILRDAEGRKESILAAAEEEKNKILSKSYFCQRTWNRNFRKAEIEAKSKRERVISL